MLQSLKVLHKILLIAALALLGMAAIFIAGQYGMRQSVKALNDVYKDRVVPLRDIKEIADLYAVDIVDLSHKARNGNIEFDAARQRIEQAERKIDAIWSEYLKTELVPEEKKLVDEIKTLRESRVAPIARLKNILAARDLEALAEYTRKELYPTIEPLSDKFSELIELQLDVAKREYENSVSSEKTISIVNIFCIVIAPLLSIGLALYIARQINHELGGEPAEAARLVTRIAKGELDERIALRPGDETSMLAAMERMRTSLHDIITRIRASAEQMDTDAQAMSENGGKVMEAVNVQNQATSAIAAAVEQMSVNVGQISESAVEASRFSRESSQTVDQGIDVVEHSVAGMNDIMSVTENTEQLIQSLANESSEIGKIINVIKTVADQTNLLALNAAIEAARAGEAGRGFAVVADEVRKLAERTTASTSEIVDMVEKIRSGTESTLSSTEASHRQVAEGVELANGTGTSMRAVKNKIEETLAAVDNITAALAEQSSASQQVGRDIERIAQMTDENATSVGQLNENVSHIKNLSADLTGLVRHFHL